MSLLETTLEGTITSDGELRLDAKPDLPAGRVTVVVRANDQAVPPAANWWVAMQKARAEMEAAGCRFESDEEIEARIAELRGDEDRIDALLRGDPNPFGEAEGN